MGEVAVFIGEVILSLIFANPLCFEMAVNFRMQIYHCYAECIVTHCNTFAV